MVTRIGGSRRKSRQKMSKHFKEKGKLSIRRHLQTFEDGDKVVLKADSSYQHGLYALRYHGNIGTVAGKQGACYKVDVRHGDNIKELVVHPVHLRKQNE